MPRRQRQLVELRALCRSGAVARAVDLAYGYIADFGRDEEVLALLIAAVEGCGASDHLRRRVEDLDAGCTSRT